MTIKSSESKFYNVDEQELFKLQSYAKYLSKVNGNPGNVMLSAEDVYEELMIEVLKGLATYGELPIGQKMAVIKRMMFNRISELRYRHYVTYRKVDGHCVDVDDDEADSWMDNDAINPESIYESKQRMLNLYTRLSSTAKAVLEACVCGNVRLSYIMNLVILRASAAKYIHKNIKPVHVANALFIAEKDVIKAFKEIKTTYLEVCNE